MKMISKSAIEAEIKRLIDCCYKMCAGNLNFLKRNYPEHYYSIETYKELLSFLDTIEVKEVDLEKEVANWWNDRYKKMNDDYEFGKYNGHYMENSTIISLAKHFFELGLKAKEE